MYSIAGLLAARICSEFFEHVIIVEPEEWLTSEDGMRRFAWKQEHKRTRVMQYQSLHGSLNHLEIVIHILNDTVASGSQALLYAGLRKLFPDLAEQCRYSGIA